MCPHAFSMGRGGREIPGTIIMASPVILHPPLSLHVSLYPLLLSLFFTCIGQIPSLTVYPRRVNTKSVARSRANSLAKTQRMWPPADNWHYLDPHCSGCTRPVQFLDQLGCQRDMTDNQTSSSLFRRQPLWAVLAWAGILLFNVVQPAFLLPATAQIIIQADLPYILKRYVHPCSF